MTSISRELLGVSPVIPVVVVDGAADAVPIAEALLRGGVGIIEITLRTPGALAGLAAVAKALPEMRVGAGTVVTPDQVAAAQEAGATFLVSPGATDTLIDAAMNTALPFLPGAGTVSEMLALRERGLDTLKFFPAEASGGRAYLSSVAGPLPDLAFCPTGGVSAETAAAWLALPNVGCVGGSWLTPKDAVRAQDWDRIARLAQETVTLRG
ncbi:bifunctional 4-hydroxy-2-oxoglutarate aldolase/2-dehydro-3-deoxy-phosphogluconate aldolase [Asanoa sp. WMMD1127]|uniref:bifunctional 4-hydroxy-2-oxoglutarate aldolase/2-dehydro-3-deoxy-phosphogluconate aldolase n=1 Tax=Asanoa sp. WMMD1127 TaxID=3016107 RepID=UPI00241750DC|nr:bifunctional 4-hydroxy-2-oxoglutarate aldolase/2-dehydro-3-deoxy-phosphogluconate aldolase [Asanoa sp. WMMD1127]MDG4824163.1 bifunctional 4-hydroxy-2-oxoglutarate aldolase/2-dehydro-3-deoxy-phosphogluconate aldolase [Asanoa sp. WMMD1127]